MAGERKENSVLFRLKELKEMTADEPEPATHRPAPARPAARPTNNFIDDADSLLADIRDAVGEDGLLLGCGAPLGPAAGLVDAMRISPDVAPFWRMRGPLSQILREDELHGRYGSIRQTMARAFLHDRWWLNDPDVLLLGGDAPLDEVRCQAATVAAAGGLVMLGDDPRTLSEGQIELFNWVVKNRNRAGDCPDAATVHDPTRIAPRGDSGLSVEVDLSARAVRPSVDFP